MQTTHKMTKSHKTSPPLLKLLLLLVAIFISGCSPAVVSKDKFSAIHEGMTYREVVTIIGAEGEELSSNKIEGVPGVMPSVSTKMYAWQNSDGSNMNAMFQNDKLIQKAQLGLK